MLGLVREEEGIASQVLKQLGADVKYKSQVESLVGRGTIISARALGTRPY